MEDNLELVANLNDFKFLNQLNIDQEVRTKLTTNLNRIVKGSDTVLMSPIAKGVKPDVILDRWDKVFQSNNDRLSLALINYENQNKLDFGPRSIAQPWSKRRESIYRYFEPDHFKDQISKLEIHNSDHNILRPISLKNALSKLKNNTNSGLPWYKRKGQIKSDLYTNFEKYLKRKDPCVLFTRTQESGKTRNIFGYPSSDTLYEMMFYSPLLDLQRKKDYRVALLGPSYVDRKITEMINFVRHNSNYTLVSMDYSTFDATVKYALQKKAFDIIIQMYQNSYTSDLLDILDRFNNISIITPDGVIDGNHGVPSGSTFTNEVDSLAQYLIISNYPYIKDYVIQGDDSVLVIEMDKVKDFFTFVKNHGLIVNESKSYVDKDYVIYLRCLHHIDHVDKTGKLGGIYPTYRALNRIIYQERWSEFENYEISGQDYYSIRTISILENCKHHPLFREFVQFIYSIDKYSLEYSKTGLAKYIDMLNQSSGIAGVLTNQYGEDVSGIRNFETVKMINSIKR
jgi:hypothetical protein